MSHSQTSVDRQIKACLTLPTHDWRRYAFGDAPLALPGLFAVRVRHALGAEHGRDAAWHRARSVRHHPAGRHHNRHQRPHERHAHRGHERCGHLRDPRAPAQRIHADRGAHGLQETSAHRPGSAGEPGRARRRHAATRRYRRGRVRRGQGAARASRDRRARPGDRQPSDRRAAAQRTQLHAARHADARRHRQRAARHRPRQLRRGQRLARDEDRVPARRRLRHRPDQRRHRRASVRRRAPGVQGPDERLRRGVRPRARHRQHLDQVGHERLPRRRLRLRPQRRLRRAPDVRARKAAARTIPVRRAARRPHPPQQPVLLRQLRRPPRAARPHLQPRRAHCRAAARRVRLDGHLRSGDDGGAGKLVRADAFQRQSHSGGSHRAAGRVFPEVHPRGEHGGRPALRPLAEHGRRQRSADAAHRQDARRRRQSVRTLHARRRRDVHARRASGAGGADAHVALPERRHQLHARAAAVAALRDALRLQPRIHPRRRARHRHEPHGGRGHHWVSSGRRRSFRGFRRLGSRDSRGSMDGRSGR